jgi:hypothetical protein
LHGFGKLSELGHWYISERSHLIGNGSHSRFLSMNFA